MAINEDETNKITTLKPAMFHPGLFTKLRMVDDKDTMKWILIKFLKETLDYLADPEKKEEIKKLKRGDIIESWIDTNLPGIWGEYDRKK